MFVHNVNKNIFQFSLLISSKDNEGILMTMKMCWFISSVKFYLGENNPVIKVYKFVDISQIISYKVCIIFFVKIILNNFVNFI